MAPAPPTASPLRKKERRLVAWCDGCRVCAMIFPFCVFCAMVFSSSCLSMDERHTGLDLCAPQQRMHIICGASTCPPTLTIHEVATSSTSQCRSDRSGRPILV
jgi:hypothetical protein